MKKKADIRTYTLEELAKLPGKTNWGKVQATTQQELGRAIAEDSDERDLTPDWTKAELVIRRPKKSVTLRMDEELLDWFKRQGRGYQTKMQAVLRSYMEAHS